MEADTYMVIRNADGDPLIMELTTGDVSWQMPRDASVSRIKYFTHVTQQGKIYYENLVSNVVQWELPGSDEISDDARFVFESVLQMPRQEVEQALSKTFDEQAVNRQMTDIDFHFYGQPIESEVDIAPVVVPKNARRRNSVMDAPPPPSQPSNKSSPITPMQKMFDPIDSNSSLTTSDISFSSSASFGGDRSQVLSIVSPPIPAVPVTPLRTKTTMHDDSTASHPPQPVKSYPSADNSSLDQDDTGVVSDDLMERPSMSFNSRRVSARKPPLPPSREDVTIARDNYPVITQPQSYQPVASSQRYPSAVNPTSQSFPTTAATAPSTAGNMTSLSTSKPSASSEETAISAPPISPSSTYSYQPAAVIVRKTAADIDKKFKCGYLNKLAKRSGFNWKPRFCVLKNLHFVYYSDDKGTESSYKGELSITPDTTAFSDKHDLRRGYLFKVVNQWETLLLAAASEVERSEWLKDLMRVINTAKKYLMCNCILLQTAKASSLLSSDKKYFVLADGVLSFHPSNLKTYKLEGRIIISNKTSIEKMDDVNQIITITDPDSFLNRISFQFKQIDADLRINPTEQYHLWRNELFRLIDPSRLADGGISSSSGSSDRTSHNSSSVSSIIGNNSSFNALQVSTIKRASKRLSISKLDLKEEGIAPDDASSTNDLSDKNDDESEKSSEFALNIQIPLKAGTLSKQSKKTLINWQMRYFELKPFNLIYFESEELRHLPRKEFQITVESKVVAVYKSDSASRYSFKVSNQWDVLTLGAGSEAERDSWIQNISLAISYVTNCMCGYMVLIRPLLKNHRDKYYFIFGNGLISIHAGERQTSEVDGTFRFSIETVLDEVDDYNKIITLSDYSSSTSDLKTISFVFSYSDPNSKMHPSQLYKTWKSAIIRAMRPEALKKSVKNVRKDRDINGASIKIPSAGTAVGSKMNALEVVSNRRLSMQRDNYVPMNNMKAVVEAHHDDDDDVGDGGGGVDDDLNAGLERPSFLALPPPPLPPHLSRPLPTLPLSNSISTPPRIPPTISSPPVNPSTDTVHQSPRRDTDVTSNPPPRPPPMSPPITTPLMNVPHLSTDLSSSSSSPRPPPPRPPSVMPPSTLSSSLPQQSSSSTASPLRPLPPQPPSFIPTPPLLSPNNHLSNDDKTNNPRSLPPAPPVTITTSSHQSTDSTTSPRPPPPPPPLSRQPSSSPAATTSLSSSQQIHDGRPLPPTASPLRVISTDYNPQCNAGGDGDHDDRHAHERNTNLSIDAYYDEKQNSTSDSFKGEMTNASRANLKLQLARLKESNEQSSHIANASTVGSPVAKTEVNPLLHSFQAQSNPLTRQRSPVGKTDAD